MAGILFEPKLADRWRDATGLTAPSLSASTFAKGRWTSAMIEHWISNLRLAVAVLFGSAGLLVLGIQPLLYGAFVREGRLGESALGLLAATEISAIALSCAVGIAALRRFPVWLVAILGIGVLVTGNQLPADVPIFAGRAISGVGAGLLVALAASAIAMRSDVSRAAAAYLLVQTAAQYALLQWFVLASKAVTVSEIVRDLAFAALLCLPFIVLLPNVRGDDMEEQGRRPPPVGIAGLVIMGVFVGSAAGLWAYIGVWMEMRGLSAADVAPRLTASLFGQMAGAAFAMLLPHLGRNIDRALIAGSVTMICIATLLWNGPFGTLGWVLAVLTGATWLIATPALVGALAELDPSRASLPFASTAQLLGAAVLPSIAGGLFGGAGLDSVLAGFAVAALVSLIVLGLLRSRALIAS
jgi:MFS transporter, DHA1 family, inner membrane transport protein